jgi:hypothetical protein
LVGVAVLPPAFWRPYFVSSRSACSMRTLFQSTSSSSAISIGSDVLMPWPISGFFDMIVTTPSGPILMKAVGTKFAPAGAPCANTSATGSR